VKDREPFPRGTVIGKQVDGPPLSEAEHYFKCETCGGFFDMRDLAQVGSVTATPACSHARSSSPLK
jgi:hypothetical protein